MQIPQYEIWGLKVMEKELSMWLPCFENLRPYKKKTKIL